MKKTSFLIIALAAAVAAVVAAVFVFLPSEDSEDGERLRPLTIQLDWRAEPAYAAFFIAQHKGWYREQGLDVEIVEGNGASLAAQVIGSKGGPFIGVCSGSATAIARSKGIPVQTVAVYYPEVPTVLYSLGANPIRSPEDLVGKRIGLIQGSITVDEYRGLLVANGIDRSQITEVSVGWDASPLLTGAVDGLMTYEDNLPVKLRLEGHDVVNLRFREHGVHSYSLNLIVNDTAARGKPDIIRDAVEVTTRAYEFVRDNPDAAAEIFIEMFPERDPEYVRASMKVVANLIGSGQVGRQTRREWEATIATLDELGLLESLVSVGDVTVEGYLAGE